MIFAAPAFRIYWTIIKTALRRGLCGKERIVRSEKKVRQEYTDVWAKGRLELTGAGTRWQTLYGKLILCRAIDHRKFFIERLSRIMLSLSPESVLEMGSGNGFNLILLAILHPEIKTFRGIELTEEGVRVANDFLKNPPVEEIQYTTGISSDSIYERLKNRDIEFVKGDMLSLPWSENSFDLVFTCWALEQIPKKYPIAFAEARRVTKRYAVFLEAFYEAQENIFQILHLKNLDYFHAPITDVKKAGFEILRFEPMGLSKIKFTSGALLAEKK